MKKVEIVCGYLNEELGKVSNMIEENFIPIINEHNSNTSYVTELIKNLTNLKDNTEKAIQAAKGYKEVLQQSDSISKLKAIIDWFKAKGFKFIYRHSTCVEFIKAHNRDIEVIQLIGFEYYNFHFRNKSKAFDLYNSYEQDSNHRPMSLNEESKPTLEKVWEFISLWNTVTSEWIEENYKGKQYESN